jgi:hypothetical protein
VAVGVDFMQGDEVVLAANRSAVWWRSTRAKPAAIS